MLSLSDLHGPRAAVARTDGKRAYTIYYGKPRDPNNFVFKRWKLREPVWASSAEEAIEIARTFHPLLYRGKPAQVEAVPR